MSDVDGTIMQMPAETAIPYGDGESLLKHQVVNAEAAARLQSLEHAGFAVRFLTGRSEALRSITVAQLEAAGFKDVSGRLAMQDSWHGWEALRCFKRDELLDFDAVLHVGDQDVDLEASILSGTPFIHVDDFARGDSFDGAFCWICGCTALRACTDGCAWAGPRTCTTCARGENAALEAFTGVAA